VSDKLPEPYCDDGNGIVIYHGDCREILPLLPKVDLVLTDPPYGIGEAAGRNRSRGKLAAARDYGNSDWDKEPPAEWVFGYMRAGSRWQIFWGGNFFALPPSSCWLVWDKDNSASDFADCELAWTNLKKAVRRKTYRWAGMLQEKMGRDKEQRVHPTQKPLDVMTWAIQQAPDDCATILDPFMGSGTTLRAAKDLGRRAIGIEINEEYCRIAKERLRQEVFAL
jgi:DNA modification methylase